KDRIFIATNILIATGLRPRRPKSRGDERPRVEAPRLAGARRHAKKEARHVAVLLHNSKPANQGRLPDVLLLVPVFEPLFVEDVLFVLFRLEPELVLEVELVSAGAEDVEVSLL